MTRGHDGAQEARNVQGERDSCDEGTTVTSVTRKMRRVDNVTRSRAITCVRAVGVRAGFYTRSGAPCSRDESWSAICVLGNDVDTLIMALDGAVGGVPWRRERQGRSRGRRWSHPLEFVGKRRFAFRRGGNEMGGLSKSWMACPTSFSPSRNFVNSVAVSPDFSSLGDVPRLFNFGNSAA